MSPLDDTLQLLLRRESLSFEQARGAMREVMDGQALPVKLAGWLIALRMKGESPDEIAGCAAAMREKMVPVRPKTADAVDIVGSGGDQSGTVNVSTAAAFVTAAVGVPVAKHGNRAVSSKCGSADVLTALGIRIEMTPEEMADCLDATGFTFMLAPLLHPAMRHAAPVRKELGTRTVFNILGPLCNPAGVRRAVIGIYDLRLCEVMARAASTLGAERLLVVHGGDGLDEITITGSTRIYELRDGDVRGYLFDPTSYGVRTASIDEVRGGNAEVNAQLIVDVFSGRKGPIRDFIALNAAAALLVADKAAGWEAALELAFNAIDSVETLRKIEEVRSFTQGSKTKSAGNAA